MASILNVDKIRATGSTTDALTIDSSDNLAAPGNLAVTGRVTQAALPAACFHYQGSDIVGSNSVIALNTQSVLQGGMTKTTNNRIKVPIAGLYKIGFYHLANSTGAHSVLLVRVNGAHNSGGLPNANAIQFRTGQSNNGFAYQTIASLAADDEIDFVVSSGTIHGNADYNSMFVYLLG
jgi:hypothetical protein